MSARYKPQQVVAEGLDGGGADAVDVEQFFLAGGFHRRQGVQRFDGGRSVGAFARRERALLRLSDTASGT